MKLIKTIISSLFIYAFIFVIAVFLVVSFWLKTFISDSTSETVAKITVGKLEDSSAPFVYLHNSGANALVTTITRAENITDFSEEKVLSARSTVIFLTFDKIKLDEKLVPLGYKNLYRISRVTDAKGEIVYSRNPSIVDDFLKDFGEPYIQWDSEILTVFAYDNAETYKVIAADEELFLTIDNEN